MRPDFSSARSKSARRYPIACENPSACWALVRPFSSNASPPYLPCVPTPTYQLLTLLHTPLPRPTFSTATAHRVDKVSLRPGSPFSHWPNHRDLIAPQPASVYFILFFLYFPARPRFPAHPDPTSRANSRPRPRPRLFTTFIVRPSLDVFLRSPHPPSSGAGSGSSWLDRPP